MRRRCGVVKCEFAVLCSEMNGLAPAASSKSVGLDTEPQGGMES